MLKRIVVDAENQGASCGIASAAPGSSTSGARGSKRSHSGGHVGLLGVLKGGGQEDLLYLMVIWKTGDMEQLNISVRIGLDTLHFVAARSRYRIFGGPQIHETEQMTVVGATKR